MDTINTNIPYSPFAPLNLMSATIHSMMTDETTYPLVIARIPATNLEPDFMADNPTVFDPTPTLNQWLADYPHNFKCFILKERVSLEVNLPHTKDNRKAVRELLLELTNRYRALKAGVDLDAPTPEATTPAASIPKPKKEKAPKKAKAPKVELLEDEDLDEAEY